MPEWREAVEVAEQFADGQTDAQALEAARAAASAAHWGAKRGLRDTARQVSLARGYIAVVAGHRGDCIAGQCADSESFHLARSRFPEDASAQAALLRDLFGPSPFRRLPRINPTWLAWEGGTVPKLAESIYEERAFDRLPILADALEEAGCDAAELLRHLRGPAPHVRGCWAVDLVLGRG
jgi:hypothetical protein